LDSCAELVTLEEAGESKDVDMAEELAILDEEDSGDGLSDGAADDEAEPKSLEDGEGLKLLDDGYDELKLLDSVEPVKKVGDDKQEGMLTEPDPLWPTRTPISQFDGGGGLSQIKVPSVQLPSVKEKMASVHVELASQLSRHASKLVSVGTRLAFFFELGAPGESATTNTLPSG
jgi:hypothetical protein